MTAADAPPICLVLRALYLGDMITGLPALSMIRAALPAHRLMLAAPVTVGTLAVRAGVGAAVGEDVDQPAVEEDGQVVRLESDELALAFAQVGEGAQRGPRHREAAPAAV